MKKYDFDLGIFKGNVYINGVFKNYNAYTVSTTGNTLNNIDEALQFCLIN